MIAHRDPTAAMLQGWFPGSGGVAELHLATVSAPSQTLIGFGGLCRVDTPLPLRGQRRNFTGFPILPPCGRAPFSVSMLAQIEPSEYREQASLSIARHWRSNFC